MEQDIRKRSLSTSSFNEKKIFIIKLFVGFFVFVFYINSLLPQYSQGYMAALIDKVKRLESITTPKIVLIGDSNLAFGMDSKLLEDEMGMPVVNMGLHGGLGNAFHEEMAKLNVTPGDIYIICHSNYNDNNKIRDPALAWITIENNFHLWRLVRFSDVCEMVKAFPIYLRKSLILVASRKGNQIPDPVYARRSFNEYGDISLLRERSIYKKKEYVRAPSINQLAVSRINALNEYLAERGARLVIAGYPIGNGDVTEPPQEFVLFQEQLAANVQCPVISNYVDYMFGYSHFYNDNYIHLNTESAKLRTLQLISDLKWWMKSGSGTSISNDKYVDIISDVNLLHIDDFYEYIDSLSKAKDRYTIFISFKNNPALRMNTSIIDKLKEIGILTTGTEDWNNNNYVAVVENGVVIEEIMQSEKIEVSGEYDDGKMTYSITSDGRNEKNGSSILLNKEEYSENVNGLNFVVYSNETHRRLDEVGFDFSSPEPKAHRFSLK